MSIRTPIVLAALLALIAGCGDDDAPATPDGGADAGAVDAALPLDSGPVDAGSDDAGPSDGGGTDSGFDGGPFDGGGFCTTDAECQNADRCDGEEQCVDGMCAPSEAPLTCDDLMDCTTDSCDAATGCVYTPVDGDGDGDGACTDCNDADPLRHSGATEACDAEDNDCDDAIDEMLTGTFYPDCDGDGWAVESAPSVDGCTAPTPGATGCTTASPVWTSRPPQFDDFDCADGDTRAHTGVTGFFTTPAVDGIVAFDFDCDYSETPQYEAQGSCVGSAGACTTTTGWQSATVPACGASAAFIASCSAACAPVIETRTQGCR
ncbi:putative metal-binding motif-containing protein [Sandaracinus amylolyticus]|uniref:BNR repeat domain protein n=1 Tax=Sandaracinus amylolyticus TaxID=927083 RepID=A0A0F6YK84_9BACT|nr:putative metal-binding motif-containing protein [Sandaracinus amylolyticus]AKF06972.1 hypothetical protein DB32_004121 [Sandaracinus amylolyticus]